MPFLRSERDLDLESRDGVASMSSSTSEATDWSVASDWNLFPVGTECCLLCTAVGGDCLFSLALFFLLFTNEDGLSVSVLADLVGTEGFFISSDRGVLSCIKKSGVWHSTDLLGIDLATVDLTALAYDEGAGEEDDAVTSLLASPYGRAFSAFNSLDLFFENPYGAFF